MCGYSRWSFSFASDQTTKHGAEDEDPEAEEHGHRERGLDPVEDRHKDCLRNPRNAQDVQHEQREDGHERATGRAEHEREPAIHFGFLQVQSTTSQRLVLERAR